LPWGQLVNQRVQGFHSPAASGLLSLLVQRKVTKETHPRRRGLQASGNCSCVALPPASMPSPAFRLREGTPGFAGCTSVYIQRTGAHRVRPPADFSYAPSPCLRGPRLGGILPQKQGQELKPSAPTRRGSAGMHGFEDQRHRSRCRASQPVPEIARRGAAMDRRACEAVHGRTV